MWEKTLNAKGEERVSLIVRVGESSPSNAPSRKDLQIDSDIVGEAMEVAVSFDFEFDFDFGGKELYENDCSMK